MKLLLDGIIGSLQRGGGISVYFREMLRHCQSVRQEADLFIEEPCHQHYESLKDNSVRVVRRQARQLERYRDCRLGAETSGVFFSSYYRRPSNPRIPSVVTVHDFIYERYRKGASRWVHVQQKHAAIKAANAIICISEATRDDLFEFVGARSDQQVHVIHNGVSDTFRPVPVQPSSVPFVLFVGTRGGYKNFSLAAAALEHLNNIELYCVGGGSFTPKELAAFPEQSRLRIKHLGTVTDERLNELYNQAVCLIYPSSYEGFGIPVVEAMRAGCPVIAINCKAVIEVGGNAIAIVDQPSGQAVANIVKSLDCQAGRKVLVEACLKRASQFAWSKTHAKTREVLLNLL